MNISNPNNTYVSFYSHKDSEVSTLWPSVVRYMSVSDPSNFEKMNLRFDSYSVVSTDTIVCDAEKHQIRAYGNDSNHVAALIESFSKGYLVNKPPVSVLLKDGIYTVIDGNHRMRAFREIGLPDVLIAVYEYKSSDFSQKEFDKDLTFAGLLANNHEVALSQAPQDLKFALQTLVDNVLEDGLKDEEGKPILPTIEECVDVLRLISARSEKKLASISKKFLDSNERSKKRRSYNFEEGMEKLVEILGTESAKKVHILNDGQPTYQLRVLNRAVRDAINCEQTLQVVLNINKADNSSIKEARQQMIKEFSKTYEMTKKGINTIDEMGGIGKYIRFLGALPQILGPESEGGEDPSRLVTDFLSVEVDAMN